MKKISIIKFNLTKCNSAEKTAVQRLLKGYKDHSNKGEYLYNRKGILSEIPHTIISNSVILLESKDKNKVLSILRKNGGSYEVFNLYSPKKKIN